MVRVGNALECGAAGEDVRRPVAVIGDNKLVCRAVKLVLSTRLHLEVPDGDGCDALVPDIESGAGLDLVVVVSISDNGEPIAELAESSLLRCLGRVPLLIISSRPFQPFPEFQIAHLRFPFDPECLCRAVRFLLEGAPAQGSASLVEGARRTALCRG